MKKFAIIFATVIAALAMSLALAACEGEKTTPSEIAGEYIVKSVEIKNGDEVYSDEFTDESYVHQTLTLYENGAAHVSFNPGGTAEDWDFDGSWYVQNDKVYIILNTNTTSQKTEYTVVDDTLCSTSSIIMEGVTYTQTIVYQKTGPAPAAPETDGNGGDKTGEASGDKTTPVQFVGEWYIAHMEEEFPQTAPHSTDFTYNEAPVKLTFKSDGTVSYFPAQTIMSGTWYVQNGKLILTLTQGINTLSMEFTVTGDTLVYTDTAYNGTNGTLTQIFKKA